MGRPRTFDEAEVVRAAADLFARRAYDGISVDDLVGRLGVHRNSLYQVFGSKRGLYLRALRWSLREQVRPLLAALDEAGLPRLVDEPALDLLLLAAAERAPVDPEVAVEVDAALRDLDTAVGRVLGSARTASGGVAAAIVGLRLAARAGHDGASGAALTALIR